MDLQTIFYIFVIAFIISWFLVLIGMIVGGWFIFNKLKKLQKMTAEKANIIANIGRTEIVGMIFGAASTFIVNKLRDVFKSK